MKVEVTMKKEKNILLILCDQYRGDALSFKNHPVVKTPYLDSLASDGVSFDRAYSACPSCIPARASLFTGKSQTSHGRVGYEDGIAWNYEHYLAEEFSNAGYQTQGIGKMHVHPSRLQCGFQNIKLHDGYLGYYRGHNVPHYMHQEVSDDYLFDLQNTVDRHADIQVSGAECNSWVTHPWIYEERLHPTNWVADQSVRFLKTRDRTKPFFLMSSFVRPHQPLDPPASYYAMYKDADLSESAKGDWDQEDQTKRYGKISDSIYGSDDPKVRHDAKAGYYASITHVDHQIGRIITALKEDGSYDNTIILFASDHGEMLFDHSLWRKVFPYEGSIHIPLLVHVGKNIYDVRPQRNDDIVELRDVMPSLLDMAGIAIPTCVDGLSLKASIYEGERVNRGYLHGEHSFHSQFSNQFILTKTDKYIWFSETGREQYFDLAIDPREEHDAIHDAKYQCRIQELREILIQELKGREEGYSDGTKLYVGKKAQTILSNMGK